MPCQQLDHSNVVFLKALFLDNCYLKCILTLTEFVCSDYLRIWRVIRSDSDESDLQHDLCTIDSWCVLTGLVVNISKCVHLRIGKYAVSYDFLLALPKFHLTNDLGL
ncbi:hypothetical protein GJ496_003508 [Pomphorhynchus laevis]|nr:hypothetical protein GJ496_003508 [Pomphorhynchus laevis]